MNSRNFSRHEPANSIDELLSVTDRRLSTNWMLTYLDVFVLIVMLVVTLISLSNFDSSPESTENSAKIIVPDPQPINVQSPTPAQPKTPIITTTAEQLPEKKAEPDDEIIDFTEQPSIDEAQPEPAIASDSVEEEPAPENTEPATPTVIPTKTIERPELPPATTDKDTKKEEAIQAKLNQQLAALGLNDSITMTVTQGYAQLEIQDNILYRSSEAILTPSGESLLTRLTPLLQQSSGLIYIEGHTDNRPINTKQFPSNWELGAARATSVLHFLSLQQLDEKRMRAITYADTKPIANNNSEQGRRKNRRVNIVIKVADDSN